MRTIKLNLIIAFMAVMGVLSCETSDELESNLKKVETQEGLYDFYLFDVHQNVTTRITSSPEVLESSFSISPDSKKILYTNEDGIHEMNIDGTGNRLLVANGSAPCYSPDGSQVAFIKDNKLYVIQVDGTNEVPISNHAIGLWHPVWSPDGKQIACSSDNGLCLVSLDGTITPLSSANSADWYDWSGDSKALYYSQFVGGNSAQVFKHDLIQGDNFQLTDNDKYNYCPKYNPVNHQLLYSSSLADYGSDLVISNADGTNAKVIIHKGRIDSPCWSPNGDKIAFVNEVANLAIVNKDGSNYRIINEIPGACMDPQWSADGNYILYYRAIFYN